jgi:two-component system KDP operon response regulator KdpE
MAKKTILIVDDELKIIKLIDANLRARGYHTIIAHDGKEALDQAEIHSPDLVILDLLMPEVDGHEVCQRLREWSNTPILIVSALCQIKDKVTCLQLGADDYLTKPFAIEELIARIRSLLRRAEIPPKDDFPSVNIGNLEINLSRREVNISGKRIYFTSIEYKLLEIMAKNAGKVLSHELLLKYAWGPHYQQESEYLRVYISRIRKKFSLSGASAEFIKTIPGVGYQLG